jgi:homoserine O-acetyltransferase/O-succinyltransferase
MTLGSIPGTWQVGDDPGDRQFVSPTGGAGAGFTLELGATLPEVTVAYETWGELNHDRSNAVLVEHAISGDAHAAGESGPGQISKGWWDDFVGPGKPIDTDRFFVLCSNVLGGCQGTTGPSSPDAEGVPYGSRFPSITIRDQVAVEVALADALGIDTFYAVIGGSMGGMRALEWAVAHPERVQRAIVLAVGASASAEQIALCSLQDRAIRGDRSFAGGDYYTTGDFPVEGLALARGIGHVSYRTSQEFDVRFGRDPQAGEDPLRGGRYAIESYLEYHGEKLIRRFDANTYIVLSEAMNTHDVGRGRGGLESALATVRAKVTVIGLTSDRLYPLSQQEELVKFLPTADALHVIDSLYGHDGFLLEAEKISPIVTSALAR